MAFISLRTVKNRFRSEINAKLCLGLLHLVLDGCIWYYEAVGSLMAIKIEVEKACEKKKSSNSLHI